MKAVISAFDGLLAAEEEAKVNGGNFFSNDVELSLHVLAFDGFCILKGALVYWARALIYFLLTCIKYETFKYRDMRYMIDVVFHLMRFSPSWSVAR